MYTWWNGWAPIEASVSRWSDDDPQTLLANSGPAAAMGYLEVTSEAESAIHLFVSGPDYLIYETFVQLAFRGRTAADAVVEWQDWTEVPGGMHTDTALSATSGDAIGLLAKGLHDGRVYANYREHGPKWHGWHEIPGGLVTDAAPAAAPLYAFARQPTTREIWMNFGRYDTWDGWKEVPGSFRTNAAVSADWSSDKVLLVAKGPEVADQLYWKRGWYGGDWTEWDDIPGDLPDVQLPDEETPPVFTTDIAPCVANGTVLAKSSYDGRVYFNELTSDGWSEVPPGGFRTDVTPAATPAYGGSPSTFFCARGLDHRLYWNFGYRG